MRSLLAGLVLLALGGTAVAQTTAAPSGTRINPNNVVIGTSPGQVAGGDALAAEIARAEAAEIANAAAIQRAPVYLAPAAYGSVTLTLGQTDAVLTQGCSPCAINLPAGAPDNYTVAVSALTAPGGNGTVPQGTGSALIVPAAGGSVSDGYTATPGPMPFAGTQWMLQWSAATGTWTLHGAGAVQPALLADFVNGNFAYSYPGGTAAPGATTLASLFAFSNAGPATYVDAGGIIRDAAPNVPRITHEVKPPNYAPLGLLAEGSARNLVSGSNNGLSTSSPPGPWIATPGGGAWPQIVGSTGIAGCPVLYQGATNQGVLLKGGYEAGDSWMGHLTVEATAGTTVTASLYVCIPDAFGNVHANSVTVCPTLTESPTTSVVVAQHCADLTLRNQWQRIWVTTSVTATGIKDFINRQTNLTGAAGDVLYQTLPDVEVSPGPTSYIANGTGQANTRPADVPTPNSAALLNMLNGGTLVADVVASAPNPTAAPNGTVALTDPTAANQAQVRLFGDSNFPVVDGLQLVNGAQQTRLTCDMITAGQGVRLALALNDHDLELTDSLGCTANNGQFVLAPNMDALTITPGSSLAIRSIAYYPARIPHQTLQSVVATSGPWPVTVNPGSPGAAIPSNFVGVSIEQSYINGATPIGSDSGLISIYQGALGGQCEVRAGGGSGDTSTQPLASRLQSLVAFVHAIGCSTLRYGLNYNLPPSQNAATAATLAAAAAAQTPAIAIVFGVGNEPDNYAVSFAAYQAVWYANYQAVIAAVPGAAFEGPDATDLSTSWSRQFATSTSPALGPLIGTVTVHHYANGVQYSQRQDVALLTGDNRLDLLARSIPPIAALAGSGVTARMDETGSMGSTNGNTTGLTLAGAIWDLWELAVLATNGWSGADFHGGDSGSYSPVALNGDGSYRGQATLYAMVLFRDLVGGRIIPITAQLPAHITALAVLTPGGQTRVLLINRSLTQQSLVPLGSTGAWTVASVKMMTAAGCLSQSLTIGGAQITSSGGLAAVPLLVNKAAGVAPIVSPPCSAAMVTLS